MTTKEKLQLAQERLVLYLKAEKAILSGQSYEMGDVKLTRANLEHVQKMINSLKTEISALEAMLRHKARYRIVRPGW